jgi:hypothetical protein
LALQQGRFDTSSFDRALFHQDAAVVVRAWWIETQPARFEVVLPAGAMLSPRQQIARALDDRLTLERSLNTGVAKLRAAGVASQVTLRPFTEAQPHLDFVTAMMPRVHREGGPTGADRLPDAGGVFEVTPFDDSTYR